MEKIKEIEQFLPREFPIRKKPQLSLDPSKGRKLTLFLLLGTTILSVGFWLMGKQEEGEKASVFGPSPALISTPTTSLIKNKQEIIERVDVLTKGLKGSYGFYVFNLTSKQSYGFLEQETFPATSLMKLPAILTLYQEVEAGRVDLDTKYVLKNSDKQSGAGSMQYKPAGTVYTYKKMVELMGKQSDNTAFNVLRKVLGEGQIQKTINDLGMTKTSLKEFQTTPYDQGLLFRKLYSGSIITRQHRDEILGYLSDTFDETRIPAGVPTGTRVSHKVGTDIGTISDGGIVFGKEPYVLIMMSKDVLEKEAKEVLPKIAQAVWEFAKR